VATEDAPQADEEFAGEMDTSAIMYHEWFVSLRRAGFTRMEALYTLTRPIVETTRLEWVSQRPGRAQPQ
jgi:hypothetical protein